MLGQGFDLIVDPTLVFSCSLGAAQRSIDLAIDYLKTRKQFGKPLAEQQWNAYKLAEMAAQVISSRLMIRDAARHLDAKSPHRC